MIVSGRRDSRVVEPAPDVADVAAHQRADVGVDHGRRRALVLPLLAQDLARERHGDSGELLAQDGADLLLVRGGAVGVQEADGDRLDPGLAQLRCQRAHLAGVDGADDGPVGGHPLGELEPEPPRHERVGLAPERVVHARDAETAELEDVAETGGGDERGDGAAPLEDGVRRDRRPVDDALDGAGAGR